MKTRQPFSWKSGSLQNTKCGLLARGGRGKEGYFLSGYSQMFSFNPPANTEPVLFEGFSLLGRTPINVPTKLLLCYIEILPWLCALAPCTYCFAQPASSRRPADGALLFKPGPQIPHFVLPADVWVPSQTCLITVLPDNSSPDLLPSLISNALPPASRTCSPPSPGFGKSYWGMAPSCEHLEEKETQVGRSEADLHSLVDKWKYQRSVVALIGGGATKKDQRMTIELSGIHLILSGKILVLSY